MWKPSQMICMKRRSIPTIITYSRQDSGHGCYNSTHFELGEQSLSEVSQLDTFQPTSYCTVVQHSPLLLTQKERSSLLTLCHTNIQAVKSKTVNLRDYIYHTDMDIFSLTETTPGGVTMTLPQNLSSFPQTLTTLFSKIGLIVASVEWTYCSRKVLI